MASALYALAAWKRWSMYGFVVEFGNGGIAFINDKSLLCLEFEQYEQHHQF